MARRSAASNLMLAYWLPVALYVGVIFLISAQPHLKAPLPFAFGDKIMHLLEYGGLGILLARGIGATNPRFAPLSAGLLAVCLGVTVGTCDELFQATVPGRESSAFDLMADTAGVGLAQFLYRAFAR
jgi:VanZ family protein